MATKNKVDIVSELFVVPMKNLLEKNAFAQKDLPNLEEFVFQVVE